MSYFTLSFSRFLFIIILLSFCFLSPSIYASQKCVDAFPDFEKDDGLMIYVNEFVVTETREEIEKKESLERDKLFLKKSVFPRQEYQALIQKQMQARYARTEKFTKILNAILEDDKDINNFLENCSEYFTYKELRELTQDNTASVRDSYNSSKKIINEYLHFPVL